MLRRTVLAALAGLLALVALPRPADAATQTFTVPASGKFQIIGHGFGHGHGMSQYGAYGAALKGLTSTQILAFYYPGTTLGRSTGWLKVLLSGHTGSTLVVRATDGLKVRDRATGTYYPLTATGATKWRLAVAAGKTVVDFYAAGTWQRFRPGGLDNLVGDGILTSSTGRLSLVDGSSVSVYRNRLAALSPTTGATTRRIVNIVKLNNYVKGVVPAEMPASWPAAAVQAQAVAARTYAAYSRATSTRYYDICDTTSCQVYRGVGGEYAASNAAADATSSKVLTYKSKPAFTQFSSSSGGWTSAGSVPYLVTQKDPYDDFAQNPVHDWTKKVTETTLESAYPKIGDLKKIKVTSRIGDGDWGGRVGSVTLVGGKGTATVSGETLRSLFGLRSTYFTFGT